MNGEQTPTDGRTPDLVSRLTENWKDWGSPVDRDKCVNETHMAMDCKEAAEEIELLRKANGMLGGYMREIHAAMADNDQERVMATVLKWERAE